jgi:hypothetical protein
MDAEVKGIEAALDNILANKSTYTKKRVLIATDTQSTLKALAVGPIDISPLWRKLWEISLFVEDIILHYVPGHVGLVGNELADDAAKRATVQFSIEEQDKVCCTLSNLKCYLRKQLIKQWNENTSNRYQTQSLRQQILPNTPSNLKLKASSPRPFQTLYSRYRVDRAEGAGSYPRKLRKINNPSCRFCGHPRESIHHLLTTCAGTAIYRQDHDISIHTLISSQPSSLEKIALFDCWIRRAGHFDQEPSDYQIHATFDQMQKDKKRKQTHDKEEMKRPT